MSAVEEYLALSERERSTMQGVRLADAAIAELEAELRAERGGHGITQTLLKQAEAEVERLRAELKDRDEFLAGMKMPWGGP